MTDLQIRPASENEFAAVINWAADEGWNPGLDDLGVFHQTDPDGFLMGWKNDKPVSCISVVRYGKTHGFLGFYIVHPDWRGSGFGISTWNAGMAHLKGRIVGLDGVVEQQQNYARSGFQFAGTNIRFTGVPERNVPSLEHSDIRPVEHIDKFDILNYQKPFFPAERDDFIARWVRPSTLGALPPSRQSLAAFEDGKLTGFGTIRTCRNGYKIGPLFADDDRTGAALFRSLCMIVPQDAEVSLDVPEGNQAAMDLARSAGLQPVFQTARMWKGDKPDPQTRRTFGLASFELG
ncbi:GNAT family N-acetyltransferase [Pararhizobium sp. IMCC21322]|uniref:GNAT family N-acetyltransferase n=1 Tax=Pararhizobium sp. IMCC21322 TaxID=3067903 RepID=UPI002741F80A|nr:GNAT family N-acetyltransferase [Pararhizobium sp. IMCC21322]